MERYFLGGNTARGFYSFYTRALRSVDNVVLLKGGPGTGKSSLMKFIAKECAARGLDHELWYCSGDPSSLDGVYVPELSAAVVDATSPHALDPTVPVVKESVFNLAEALDRDSLKRSSAEIGALLADKKQAYARAYEYLNIALCYLNIQRRLYAESLNALAVRRLAYSLLGEIDLRSGLEKQASPSRDLFARAITPDGRTAFYDCLRGKRIYWVRGGAPAREIFFDALTGMTAGAVRLHCPLDPDKTEGIVAGGIAVTAEVGHLSGEVSEVVDLSLYEGACRFAEIEDAEIRRREAVSSAVKALSEARANHLAVEGFYVSAMDFDIVAEKRAQIAKLVFGD